MKKSLAVLGLLIAAGLFISTFASSQREEPLEVVSNSPDAKGRAGEAPLEPGYVIVGGVKRKISDIQRPEDHRSGVLKTPVDERPLFDPGKIQPVAVDSNADTQSVAKRGREEKDGSAVSAFQAPAEFDPAAYQQDPDSYLRKPAPGRVFQTAKPGPNVPQIKAKGKRLHRMNQGETIKLEFQVPPGAPVNATAFDGGVFAANKLPFVSVQANDKGLATIEYTATEGTFGEARLLVSSPTTSGQIEVLATIELSKNSQ